MEFNMSEDRINCTINHDIHLYVFSSVYVLVLLVSKAHKPTINTS